MNTRQYDAVTGTWSDVQSDDTGNPALNETKTSEQSDYETRITRLESRFSALLGGLSSASTIAAIRTAAAFQANG